MITEQHTKEMISTSFLKAVAAMAGTNLSYDVYDYGVDGTFKPVVIDGARYYTSGFPLDFQLKSSINWEINDNHVVYDLEAKTYTDMIRRREQEGAIPLVLILLCLPPERESWLSISEEMLIMKKCCYWYFVEGEPSDNTRTVRIRIPTTNLFCPDALNELLSNVGEGELE